MNPQSGGAPRVRLEDLAPGVLVTGIGPGTVTIATRRWVGNNAAIVTYLEGGGATNRAVLTRDHESGVKWRPCCSLNRL